MTELKDFIIIGKMYLQCSGVVLARTLFTTLGLCLQPRPEKKYRAFWVFLAKIMTSTFVVATFLSLNCLRKFVDDHQIAKWPKFLLSFFEMEFLVNSHILFLVQMHSSFFNLLEACLKFKVYILSNSILSHFFEVFQLFEVHFLSRCSRRKS